MGGTVINTETNRVYQNATIAKCESCPSDIDEVGYEYHAGVFVPCAPYGKAEDGNILVACEDCATPKSSGLKISELAQGDCKIQCGTFTGIRISGTTTYVTATLTFNFVPKMIVIARPTSSSGEASTVVLVNGQTTVFYMRNASTFVSISLEWNDTFKQVTLKDNFGAMVSELNNNLYVGIG
jgi:hypothetical protein